MSAMRNLVPLNLTVPSASLDQTCVVQAYRCGRGQRSRVLISAGLHGDEPTAIAALRYLLDKLPSADIAATVTVIPCINSSAVRYSSRIAPLEDTDPNRCFPGRKDGSLAERIAATLVTLVSNHDAFIDVHTAGWCIPFALLDNCSDRQLLARIAKWAQVAHVPVIRDMPVSEASLQALDRSSTAWVVQQLKIPAFTLELVGLHTIMSECARKAADWLIEYIKAAPGPSVTQCRSRKLPHRYEIYSEGEGLFETCVLPGNHVSTGTLLGLIRSECGKVKNSVAALQDGLVLGVQPISSVHVGTWLVTLAVAPER